MGDEQEEQAQGGPPFPSPNEMHAAGVRPAELAAAMIWALIPPDDGPSAGATDAERIAGQAMCVQALGAALVDLQEQADMLLRLHVLQGQFNGGVLKVQAAQDGIIAELAAAQGVNLAATAPTHAPLRLVGVPQRSPGPGGVAVSRRRRADRLPPL